MNAPTNDDLRDRAACIGWLRMVVLVTVVLWMFVAFFLIPTLPQMLEQFANANLLGNVICLAALFLAPIVALRYVPIRR